MRLMIFLAWMLLPVSMLSDQWGKLNSADKGVLMVLWAFMLLLMYVAAAINKARNSLKEMRAQRQPVQPLRPAPRKVSRTETLKPMAGIITQEVKSRKYLS